jgi:hypothetical protein
MELTRGNGNDVMTLSSSVSNLYRGGEKGVRGAQCKHRPAMVNTFA